MILADVLTLASRQGVNPYLDGGTPRLDGPRESQAAVAGALRPHRDSIIAYLKLEDRLKQAMPLLIAAEQGPKPPQYDMLLGSFEQLLAEYEALGAMEVNE